MQQNQRSYRTSIPFSAVSAGTARSFLLAACLIMMPVLLQALHIKGGWMYYQYLGTAGNGNHLYELRVKVYRDCVPPNPGQNDANINVSVWRGDNNQFIGNFGAPLVNTYRLQKGSFSECISPRPDVCYVILEYSTVLELPATAGGYIASFQRCCRINGIVNILQPSNSLGNSYYITIPGTANVRNSSPIFAEKDTAVVCFNSFFELDYSATDPDGDSLEYEWAPALIGASTGNPAPGTAAPPPYSSLPYNPAFTPNDPFGTNVTLDTRTGIIRGRAPSTTGEYVLAVLVREYRNGVFIAETRKELHVNVANCTTPDAELPVRIISCDGFDVTFENLSASPAINSYFWDFGVPSLTNDTSTEARPTYRYADTGIYTAKLVVNRGQACSDSTTTEVRVYPGFFPDFTNDGACFTNPFQFFDASTTRYGVVDSWRWNFGDAATNADTSRLRNPVYRYPSPGIYNVTLEVGSDKGCNKTISKPVEVLDRPRLTLPFRDTLICSIDSLQLRAVGTGQFSWTPTTRMVFDNTPTPTVFPQTTTTYRVTLNDRGCIASDSIRVNVLDFITVDAGPDTTICLTDGVMLRPVSQGLAFEWTPTGTLNNPNIRNPIATPTAPATTYRVRARLGKCDAFDSVTVRTVPYPIANAGRDTIICFGDAVILRGSGNGIRYEWSPPAIVTNRTSPVAEARPTSTTSFVLAVYDDRGCPKPGLDTVRVTVTPPIQVFAGNDTSIVMGQPLQLNGQSNAPLFSWSPPTGLSATNIPNPVARFVPGTLPDAEEFFTYTLTASTAQGCSASDDITVRIFKTAPSIFVPNAFTPNGDGRNDVIRPVLAGIQRLDYFRVFNRYGQLIFETREPGRGWDGLLKGQPQASGAFVYHVQATDYLGNTLRQSGTFVLIR